MFVAVDKDGDEYIYRYKPSRYSTMWSASSEETVKVTKGTIQRLLNYPLTWEDDCQEIVEYKDKDKDYQGTETELLLGKIIDFKDEEYIKLEKKVFNLKKQLEKHVVKIANQKEELTRLLAQKEDLQNRLNIFNKTVGMSINNDIELIGLLEKKDGIIKYLESKLEI